MYGLPWFLIESSDEFPDLARFFTFGLAVFRRLFEEELAAVLFGLVAGMKVVCFADLFTLTSRAFLLLLDSPLRFVCLYGA